MCAAVLAVEAGSQGNCTSPCTGRLSAWRGKIYVEFKIGKSAPCGFAKSAKGQGNLR